MTPLPDALDALMAEMRDEARGWLADPRMASAIAVTWADRLAALRAASEPKTADVSPSELSRALTDARLAVNDWHPCATHEELGRWREAQQRLIDAAKACGEPTHDSDQCERCFSAGFDAAISAGKADETTIADHTRAVLRATLKGFEAGKRSAGGSSEPDPPALT